MAYNFDKHTCDVCGCEKPPRRRYGTYQEQMTDLFRLGYGGEVWCAKCHKEKELKELFALMDARDAKLAAKTF